MKIQFRKLEGKPSILNCVRADGSSTWVKMYPGIEAHDLGHYAVETLLNFENAFYGMVAKGTNIEDFELPREQRPDNVIPKNLDPEALISEHLVNLIMTKAQTQDENFDIVHSLKTILEEKELPYPKSLTNEKMDNIWSLFNELNQRWKLLPFGATMNLDFELTP